MQTKKLKIIPLGGLGEFGMNCLALRWEDDIIVIDAGLMFPESELLGVDIVVPDISYLVENKAHVRAIILTHGHMDHIGALPWILSEIKVPVYATEFTLAHLNVSPEVRAHNITVSHYEAGQMTYADNKALAKLQGDLARFVNEAISPARK